MSADHDKSIERVAARLVNSIWYGAYEQPEHGLPPRKFVLVANPLLDPQKPEQGQRTRLARIKTHRPWMSEVSERVEAIVEQAAQLLLEDRDANRALAFLDSAQPKWANVCVASTPTELLQSLLAKLMAGDNFAEEVMCWGSMAEIAVCYTEQRIRGERLF